MTYLTSINNVNPEIQHPQTSYCKCKTNLPQQCAFRGDRVSTPELKADTVEISKDKVEESQNEEVSTGAKWGIGLGIAGTLATVALLIKKNRFSEVKELAENINFSKATSLEEAIEFGKKNLGIKKYSGFESKDLDVINWLNEGFVNTSNKLKGKLRMPKYVHYTKGEQLSKNTLAGVITEGKYSGYFAVNKNIFDNLNPKISQNIENLSKIIKINKNGSFNNSPFFSKNSLKPLARKIEKFNNNEINTFDEKVDLLQELYTLSNERNSINNAPLLKIKSILELDNVLDILKRNNIETNIQKIKNLSITEQTEFLSKIIDCAKTNNIKLVFNHEKGNKFSTIYHEMGHLQDDVVRPQSKEKFKTQEEYPSELKEWLDNSEYQQIAASVSEYSCSGPEEFIAETFAKLISGQKLKQDAIELYKKLKGPLIPGM